ncbi:MAG: hypothetical protein IKT99_06845 [Oscillospiraceae bacterium]|jgi:hypothetical protein|nr:hypothetical protein [Oscillospiraceae bacterium]
MALHLSKQDREQLLKELAAAEPYTNEEVLELDGDIDTARWKATMAKKFLQEANKEVSQE